MKEFTTSESKSHCIASKMEMPTRTKKKPIGEQTTEPTEGRKTNTHPVNSWFQCSSCVIFSL